MEQDSQGQYPEDRTKEEHHQSETPQVKGAKSKVRNQRLVVFEWCSILLFTFAGVAFFVAHLAIPSILLLLIGCVLAALAVRLELRGHGARKRTANLWCAGIIFASTTLSLLLAVIVYKTSETPTAQSLPPQAVLRIPHLAPQPKIAIEPLEFRQKHANVTLLIGSNEIELAPAPEGIDAFTDLWRFFGGPALEPGRMTLKVVNEQLIFDFRFGPVSGVPSLKLENNELSGLPSDWDFNHTSRAIEIVNEKSAPICQLFYKDDTHLVFDGVVIGTNFMVVAPATGEMLLIREPQLTKDDFSKAVERVHLTPLFKYPAFKFPGRFVEPDPKAALKPKLVDCLMSLDPRIIPELRSGKTVSFDGRFGAERILELQKLCDGSEAKQYISLAVGADLVIDPNGQSKSVHLEINPSLLK